MSFYDILRDMKQGADTIRQGIRARTSPATSIAEAAWHGAGTNDPQQTASEALGTANAVLPAAVGAEGYRIAGQVGRGVLNEVDRMKGYINDARMMPWVRRNGPLIKLRNTGFRTRALQPLPNLATTNEAIALGVDQFKRNWPFIRQGIASMVRPSTIAKGLASAAGAYQAVSGGLEGAYKGLNTPTEEYQQRTGIENPTLARTAGVLGDVGDATTFGLASKAGKKLSTLY